VARSAEDLNVRAAEYVRIAQDCTSPTFKAGLIALSEKYRARATKLEQRDAEILGKTGQPPQKPMIDQGKLAKEMDKMAHTMGHKSPTTQGTTKL
jgi:hypothetical protein